MSLIITSSLDWDKSKDNLMSRARKLNSAKDMNRLVANIDALVQKLSMAEVHARRNHDKPSRNAAYLLEQVNTEIINLDKMLFFAALYK